MNKAKLLLEKLTEMIPPGKGMRHNLTLNDSGALEITLMTKNKYICFSLDDSDMGKDTILLCQDLFIATKNELNKSDE